MRRLKRRLAEFLDFRVAPDLGTLSRYVVEGFQRGLSRPDSLPGTVTLAEALKAPQTPTQAVCGTELYEDRSCRAPGCEDGCTLLPRADRCPVVECAAGAECWRCDYEDSQHGPAGGLAC